MYPRKRISRPRKNKNKKEEVSVTKSPLFVKDASPIVKDTLPAIDEEDQKKLELVEKIMPALESIAEAPLIPVSPPIPTPTPIPVTEEVEEELPKPPRVEPDYSHLSERKAELDEGFKLMEEMDAIQSMELNQLYQVQKKVGKFKPTQPRTRLIKNELVNSITKNISSRYAKYKLRNMLAKGG